MNTLLFTGGSGFLGRNIRPVLDRHYAVTTCGNAPADDIYANLAAEIPVLGKQFDIVLHACGKAHMVPRSPEEIQSFFDVNYKGTVNLCRALENVGVPRSMIFISTVAVYGCEEGELITEDHPLNGSTPYARSKIMAEEFLAGWCADHGVTLTVLRPSLLAGKNPPGNLGDMISGIEKGYYVNIAGGKVCKSILMAEDIANLIPLVKDRGGAYNVCDTDQPTFGALARSIARQLGKKQPVSVPYWMAKSLALIGDVIGTRFPINSARLTKITQSLTFSNRKVVETLGWEPMKVLDNFIVR